MPLLSAVSSLLLCSVLARAAPLSPRLVKLDPTATAEAQKRDDTATRAFSSTEIKTSDGEWDWRSVFVSGHIAADLVTAVHVTAGTIRSADGTILIDLDNGGKRITPAEAVKGLKPFVK